MTKDDFDWEAAERDVDNPEVRRLRRELEGGHSRMRLAALLAVLASTIGFWVGVGFLIGWIIGRL